MPERLPAPLRALLAWLEEHGARFQGARAESIPGMGTGLVATADLEAEDQILLVPQDLWVTVKSAHTDFAPLVAAVPDDACAHAMSRFALLVALEQQTPASFFRIYLNALGEPTVPYALAPEERAMLQGLPMEGWVDDQRAEFAAEAASLRDWLHAEQGHRPTPCVLDASRWEWALGHVMQRCFSVDLGGDEVWVVVPGMDLCNHADEPNARYFADGDGWLLEAARPIEKGEQITIRYGRVKTSSDLLLYYGFVTPDNRNDRLKLRLVLAPDDPDGPAKEQALELLGLEDQALLDGRAAVPAPFLHAAILWQMPSEAFRREEALVPTPALAIAALEAIEKAVRTALAAFPTTLEEDVARRERPFEAAWGGAFLEYRINVKQLHIDVAAGLQRRIAEIRASGWEPGATEHDDPDGRYGMAEVLVRVGPTGSTLGAGGA